VESIRDVLAIEETNQFNGRYHVLGGLISPIEGIGPEDLNVESLKRRIEEENIKEIIMALNPTIDGDTTIFYISRLLKQYNLKISMISRGVSFGGELEYTDELTLGRSILARVPYEIPD
jgi:recombination protein RecR